MNDDCKSQGATPVKARHSYSRVSARAPLSFARIKQGRSGSSTTQAQAHPKAQLKNSSVEANNIDKVALKKAAFSLSAMGNNIDKVALKKAAFSLSAMADASHMPFLPAAMGAQVTPFNTPRDIGDKSSPSKLTQFSNISSPLSSSQPSPNVPTVVQNLKMDRSIQTSPEPIEAEMLTHCERLVRRGKQNLLSKVNQQKDVIGEQQNTIEGLQRELNEVTTLFIDDLQRQHSPNEVDLGISTPALNGDLIAEDDLDDTAISSMQREFPKEAEVDVAETDSGDILTILFRQFDADVVSQAMWLRYKSMSCDTKDTFATGQANKALEILSAKDNVEHSAYDLLMQFIAFDAMVPSQTVRDNYLLAINNEKSYTQKEAEDIACFDRFIGNLKSQSDSS